MEWVEKSQGQKFVTDDDSMTLFDEEGDDVSKSRSEEIDEDWFDLLKLIDEKGEFKQSLLEAYPNISRKLWMIRTCLGAFSLHRIWQRRLAWASVSNAL